MLEQTIPIHGMDTSWNSFLLIQRSDTKELLILFELLWNRIAAIMNDNTNETFPVENEDRQEVYREVVVLLCVAKTRIITKIPHVQTDRTLIKVAAT